MPPGVPIWYRLTTEARSQNILRLARSAFITLLRASAPLYYWPSQSMRVSGNVPGRGASRDCGAAPRKRVRRRCSEAMHTEHADASVRLQARRSYIRHGRTRVAGIESYNHSLSGTHPPTCMGRGPAMIFGTTHWQSDREASKDFQPRMHADGPRSNVARRVSRAFSEPSYLRSSACICG
jgi:hypothetical protein